MGLQYGGQIVKDGLVLCFDAADKNSYPGTGTTWTDVSGNGYNGTLTNGPTFNSANNGSISFDGTNDYAVVNTAKVIPDTGAFSVVFAFSLTGTGGRGGIFERKTSSPYNGFSFGQGGTGSWYSSIIGSDGSLSLLFTYPSANVFYIDVVTYNGSTSAKAYRNGSLIDSDTNTSVGNLSTNGTRQNLNIARRDTESSELPCKVSYIQVYTKELSAEEVLQNYNASKSRFGLT